MSHICFWKYFLQYSQGRLMDIVQLSHQAEVVQPLQGKGYLDNEREMRIPASPSPDCLRKDANVCTALPGGQIGPDQARVFGGKLS